MWYWKEEREYPESNTDLFCCCFMVCHFANCGKQLSRGDRLRKKIAVIAVKGKGAILKMYYFSIIFYYPPTPNYKPTTKHHADVQRNKTNHPIFYCLTILNRNYNRNVVSYTTL